MCTKAENHQKIMAMHKRCMVLWKKAVDENDITKQYKYRNIGFRLLEADINLLMK